MATNKILKPKSKEEIDHAFSEMKKGLEVNVIDEIIGKTIQSIRVNQNDGIEDSIHFDFEDFTFVMYHNQDCCECVLIEDINGDMRDLIGMPLIAAEEVSCIDDHAVESGTWTFYKLATARGYVTIRWYGSSNGYYSESVDFNINVINRGE